MAKPMKEKFVKQKIIKWLRSKGWGLNLEVGEKRDHGVDIRVRNNKYGRWYLIETKGEGKTRSTSENSFVVSLGQIITRMNVGEAGYYYGLGLPDTIAKIAVGRIPWQVAKKLQLRILSVDKTGRVQEITSKDLKKKQSQKEDALLIETRRQEPCRPYSEIRQELKKKRRLK